MGRAAKICSSPGCPQLQPCPTHKQEAWAGSTRRTKTGSGSRQQKRARFVLRRDAGICHICGQPGADEADHVIPVSEGGEPGVDNMAAVHSKPCHAKKTQAEAARARRRSA